MDKKTAWCLLCDLGFPVRLEAQWSEEQDRFIFVALHDAGGATAVCWKPAPEFDPIRGGLIT